MIRVLPILMLLLANYGFSQDSIDQVLEKYNNKSIPYITVSEVKLMEDVVLLDARETNEFEVSHLDGAIYVGHEKFKKKFVTNNVDDKEATIVVYCSIGVRSEQIAQKVKKLGYTNVYNLYGGIFDWKNKDGKVVDVKGKTTDNVHTYSKEWSSYLKKGKKIY